MHGLDTIRAINDNACRVAEEKARKLAGVKPRGVIGTVIRDAFVRPEKSVLTAGVKKVLSQGRYIEV